MDTNSCRFKRELLSLGIQPYSQMMIGVSNHLLTIVFRFHYHSQEVIGSLGCIYYLHDYMFHPIILGIDPLVWGDVFWANLKVGIASPLPSMNRCLNKFCSDGILFEDCLVPYHLQCTIVITTMFHNLTYVKDLIP